MVMAGLAWRGMASLVSTKIPNGLTYNRSCLRFNTNSTNSTNSTNTYRSVKVLYKQIALRDPKRTVVVSNIPWYADKQDIRDAFSEFGEISKVTYQLKQNGFPNGVAKVLFRKETSLHLNNWNNVLIMKEPVNVFVHDLESKKSVNNKTNPEDTQSNEL